MKTKIVFITLNLILSIILENISVLPWWSFLLMSLLMGFIYSKKDIKVKPFINGFISGFINWFTASLFFHYLYEGVLMEKVAVIFFMPSFLLMIVIGIVCGLLNGLACYAGYSVFVKEDVLELD